MRIRSLNPLRSKLPALSAILVVGTLLLAGALYWPGLDGPFLLDDRQNIVRLFVEDFDPEAILYATTHNTSGSLGRPVSAFSFALTGILHGPGPWGYKYHNLLLHLLNGLLIFWLLLRLLPHLTQRLTRNRHLIVAGAVAAVWLLHPLMVSTVLYAVQRMAELSAFFTLIALLCYVYFRQNASRGMLRPFISGYFGFPLALVLAMLSKESGALIPIYVLVLEFIAFRFGFVAPNERSRVFTFWGVFVLAALILGGGYGLTHLNQLVNYSLRDFTIGERLLTQLHVMLLYLKLILLPQLSDMTLFHDYYPVVREFDFLTAILLAALGLGMGLVFFLRKRAPVAAFAMAWFLVSHALESTFLSLELVFEHRNYLAAMGPLLAAVYYLLAYPRVRYQGGFLLLFMGLLVLLTYGRVQEWRSTEMFYRMAVTEHPLSSRAQVGYANVKHRQGFYQLALEHLDNAQEIDPEDYGPLLHKAVFMCSVEDEKVPEIVAEAAQKAREYPASPYVTNALSNLLGRYGKRECPSLEREQLMALVRNALAQEDNAKKPMYIAYFQRFEGQLHLLGGEYVAGVEDLFAAYGISKMPAILMELVEVQLKVGNLIDAEYFINQLERDLGPYNALEAYKMGPLKERLRKLKLERSTLAPSGPNSGAE